jgi:uncharacterized RDD family membrane protein YckC
MVKKRIAAGIIDFLVVVIPLCILCNWLIFNVINKDINPQTVPFIVFQAVLFPFGVLQHAIEYPSSWGVSLKQMCFLLSTMFIFEVIFYSVFELSALKRTLGKKAMGLKYDRKFTITEALIRNSIKTLTRYLFGIPLVIMFFRKDSKALQDLVVDNALI